MKLLLAIPRRDEILPIRLKYRFSLGTEVSTVTEEGWNSLKDGELLVQMQQRGFSILVTADKNLRHQQNLQKHQIVVILLLSSNNRYALLKEFIPLIEQQLPLATTHGVIELSVQ